MQTLALNKTVAVATALALVALYSFAPYAEACEYYGCWGPSTTDNSVVITVINSADVDSTTKAKADTGDNSAEGSAGGDGSNGGSGGSGGDADANYDYYWWYGYGWYGPGGDANGGDGGDGGNGGRGGDGGPGGLIRTGNADAQSDSLNVVNTALVRVGRGG